MIFFFFFILINVSIVVGCKKIPRILWLEKAFENWVAFKPLLEFSESSGQSYSFPLRYLL